MPLVVHLTADQANAVELADAPVQATDPQSRAYVILRAEVFERMMRVLETEELDRTFYECEDEMALP